jgi:hypothetical protein
MKNQLLIEEYSNNESVIVCEASEDSKNLFLKGIFMQADVQNRNKRIYPLHEMCQAVASANRMIAENGGIFGEADHPNTLNINIDRISHVITELYMDGSNAIGKAKILDTPMGKIVKELTKTGVKIGVSSRGTGQVNEEGLVSGFNIVSVDVVVNPSAIGATPTSIYENLQSYKKNERIITLAESLQTDKAAQKYFTREIDAFLKSLLK